MDNHFTINYLQAIKTHLHIDFNTDNRAVFYPDKVCNSDFINLKKTLDQIWKETESAISILRTREEAFVQMGLFGLVDDLDLAVKVGFSLGDRIVGKSSVSCPLKPSDSAPLKHSTMPP